MRVFWVLVILVVLAGGAFLAVGQAWTAKRSQIAATVAREAAQKERLAIDSMIAAEASANEAQAAAKSAANESAATNPKPRPAEMPAAEPASPPAPATPAPAAIADTTAPSPAAVPANVPDAVDLKKDLIKPGTDEFAPPAPAPAGTTATPQADAKAAEKTGDKAGDAKKEYEIVPSTLVKEDDGSTLADGKFKIRGEGTEADPYRTTWEHLVSAEKTFDPKNKKRGVPESIAMMDGKWVRLDGYVAFPLMIQTPRECLVMLNQWDGCCIGVPPTPYDAIESRLKKAVTGEARFATAGTITGKLSIKPYIVGDWLVGLYLIDEGKLESRTFDGFGGS